MKRKEANLSVFVYIISLILAFNLGVLWSNLELGQRDENKEVNISELNLELQENKSSSAVLSFDLLNNVWKKLQNKYVDPEIFSEKEPFEHAMIKGLVYGLEDPFSSFMTPEENKEFRNDLGGNFEGIGAELTTKNGIITVVTPLKGSPAKESGLMPEDIILKVNDVEIEHKGLFEVVQLIRGPKGTDVTLTVFRSSLGEQVDVVITRETINVPSVESEILDNNIALIELNRFGDKTNYSFAKQFKNLISKSPKGLILDLRYNGGGYLDGAVSVSSAFFRDKVDIVHVQDRDSIMTQSSVYQIYANQTIPVVVLINKGSASASEIVAGALQDHKRATVIGEKSFGKGTVQEVLPLSGGGSLRVTVAEWLTPNKNTINKTGITPDVIVEKTKEDHENDRDPQMEKALEIINNGKLTVDN